jgi:hypothetical protein
MRILVRLSSVGRSTQTAQFDEAGSRSVAEAVEFRQLLMRLRSRRPSFLGTAQFSTQRRFELATSLTRGHRDRSNKHQNTSGNPQIGVSWRRSATYQKDRLSRVYGAEGRHDPNWLSGSSRCGGLHDAVGTCRTSSSRSSRISGVIWTT